MPDSFNVLKKQIKRNALLDIGTNYQLNKFQKKLVELKNHKLSLWSVLFLVLLCSLIISAFITLLFAKTNIGVHLNIIASLLGGIGTTAAFAILVYFDYRDRYVSQVKSFTSVNMNTGECNLVVINQANFNLYLREIQVTYVTPNQNSNLPDIQPIKTILSIANYDEIKKCEIKSHSMQSYQTFLPAFEKRLNQHLKDTETEDNYLVFFIIRDIDDNIYISDPLAGS